ncbi:hypothetical protein [Streptomyces sp.]|uniref:hypothetical protein n=1 Tax=Streptomyces sp. TaxID=1931 RepID=UPI002F3F1E25
MIFPSDLTDDPLLARSDKCIRWGAAVPMLGLCVIAVTARLLDPGRGTFVSVMLFLSAVGQVLTWWGMHGVRRSRGWDSGVLFYIWVGGFLDAMAIASTAVLSLAPIPLLAPLVATFARWRLHRESRRVGAPR